ncbi:hypothetical protein ACFYS7_36265 [Streptomyces avermitilis]|uniref:hypothetical protein n=1 Tax=Streptomyces avermitilis TaxID=33903 RepID=UPI003677D676
MKGFGKYWGWIVFAVLITGWLTFDLGPVALLVLSGVSAFYFFFNVPVWCGAEGRGGSCRQQPWRADGLPPSPTQVAEAEDDLLERSVGSTSTGALPERHYQPG